MPSTYTANLGIEKPATGEQAGTWGVTANVSYDTLDMAIDGSLTIALSASTYQLATQQGGEPQPGVNRLITWTGAQTQAATVTIWPGTVKKLYYMQNKTTGGFPISFSQGAGSVYSLQAGYTAILYTDGAGSGANVSAALDNPQFQNVMVTGNMQVAGSLTFGSAQNFVQPFTFNGAVTLNGATTVQTLTVTPSGSTSAPWDLYYRSGGGSLARLAVGSPGQVLMSIAGPAIQWGTIPPLGLGSSITSSLANAIYFSNASNVLAQDSAILINNTVGIGVGVLPSHSLHLGYARAPEIWLDTNNPASGSQRQIVFATNNAPRWHLYSPSAGEPGGNQASDLGILAWNDPANATRWVMYMTRSNGNITVGPPGGDQGARLSVMGDNAGQYGLMIRGATGQTGALQAWENVNGSVVASMDPAGNLTCGSINASGALSVVGGSLNVTGNITVGGTFTANTLNYTNLNLSGDLYVGSSGTTGNITATTRYNVQLGGPGGIEYFGQDGQITYYNPNTGITGIAKFVRGIFVQSSG